MRSLRRLGREDTDALVVLWRRAVPTWPIPPDRLRAVTSDCYVAENGGEIVGAVALDEAGTMRMADRTG